MNRDLEKIIKLFIEDAEEYIHREKPTYKIDVTKIREIARYYRLPFDDAQLEEIKKGLESGVKVSYYADPQFSAEQMREIRLGLENNVDIQWYAKIGFTADQMEQIRYGLEDGLDVSTYAKYNLSADQMEVIRLDLQFKKLNVKN